jgi:hypothetical protein
MIVVMASSVGLPAVCTAQYRASTSDCISQVVAGSRDADRRDFDYGTLTTEHADAARSAAKRIQARAAAAVLDTGRDLIAIKSLLEHGQFGDWLRAEFGMSIRSAQDFMRASALADEKYATVAFLPASVVLQIARAPARVQDHVLERLATGEISAEQVGPVLRATARELRLTSGSRSCAPDPSQPQKDEAATRPTEPNADLATHLTPIVADAITRLATMASTILEATKSGPDADDRWAAFCRALRIGLKQAFTPAAPTARPVSWQNLRDTAFLSPTITPRQRVFLATLGTRGPPTPEQLSKLHHIAGVLG